MYELKRLTVAGDLIKGMITPLIVPYHLNTQESAFVIYLSKMKRLRSAYGLLLYCDYTPIYVLVDAPPTPHRR